MSKNIRFIILVGLLILGKSEWLLAQQSDFGIWTSASIDARFTKKWRYSVAGEYRLKENATQSDQLRGALQLTYVISKKVRLGAGYDIISDFKRSGSLEYRHRLFFQTLFRYQYHGFAFSWRPRVQLTIIEQRYEPDYGSMLALRNRMQIDYQLPGIPLKPFVSAELYHRLQPETAYPNYKNRYTAGIEYQVTKNNQLEIYYRIDQERNVANPLTSYIVGIGYQHSL